MFYICIQLLSILSNTMKKLVPLTFSFILLCASCSSLFKRDVVIDNPISEDITVWVGKKKYNIPSLGKLKTSLAKGEHKVLCENMKGEELMNHLVTVSGEGIINPTFSTYVLWRDLYINEGVTYDDISSKALNNKNTSIGNKVYKNVDFFVYDSVPFIAKNWDYDLYTDWPEKMNNLDEEYVVKSKIYRLKDLEESWGFYGNYDVRNLNPKELKLFIDSIESHFDSTNTIINDTVKAN